MDATLKKLRIKFVAIIMAIVTVLLAGIFTTICIVNYNQGVSEVYDALDQGIERDSDILEPLHLGKGQFSLIGDPSEGARDGSGPMLLQRKFQIGGREHQEPFIPIAVFQLEDGEMTALEGTATAQISSDVLSQLGSKMEDVPDGHGFLPSVGMYYAKREMGDGTYVAFADEASASDWKGLALSLAAFGALALAIFFIISLLFSKWALRPVQRSWNQQKQFIADASHELKTPLTVMAADASILKGHPERTVASQSQWIESMETEIASMQELVGDMLLLASADAGAVDHSSEKIDLSKLVNSHLLQFESLAYEHGCDVSANIEDGVFINAAKDRIARLVSTLLDNAFKYAGEGGSIKVGLSSSQKEAVLAISNSGETIPPEDLPHIFDRFYRVDKARGRDSGRSYGLGLAIASEIASECGGSLRAESSPSSGTTFTFSVPLARG